MKNLDKLAELASTLPAATQELVTKMGEVIEGIGDRPVVYHPALMRVVQGTSDRSKLPKGATIGSIVIGEEIAEQPFEVIPLRTWTIRQYWNPDPENSQMLCNSPDAQVGFRYGKCRDCQFSKFDEEANKSQCNKVVSVLAISSTLDKLFYISFSKTNYSNGTDWVGLMKKAGVSPFKRTYVLKTETSKKSKNVEVLTAAHAGITPTEKLPFLEELFKISGEERTESLKSFYEYIETKKADTPLPAIGYSPADDGHATIDSPVSVLEPAVADSVVDKLGTKYEM